MVDQFHQRQADHWILQKAVRTVWSDLTRMDRFRAPKPEAANEYKCEKFNEFARKDGCLCFTEILSIEPMSLVLNDAKARSNSTNHMRGKAFPTASKGALGFTLSELLVVIAIIAILGSLSLSA